MGLCAARSGDTKGSIKHFFNICITPNTWKHSYVESQKYGPGEGRSGPSLAWRKSFPGSVQRSPNQLLTPKAHN